MFPFMIPVTLYSHPIILTNMIHLRDSVTYITKLTHHAVRLHSLLFISLPIPLNITHTFYSSI